MISIRIAQQQWTPLAMISSAFSSESMGDADRRRFDVIVQDGHGRQRKLATLPRSQAEAMLERLSDELRDTSQEQFVAKRPHLRKLRLD